MESMFKYDFLILIFINPLFVIKIWVTEFHSFFFLYIKDNRKSFA